MQPDYNQTSAFLLFELLKATTSNGSQSSLPSSPTSSFSPSPSDEWINSLWFVSLTLSLITALVAVLVKQWLHQYVAIVSDSSARDRARIRHMRFAGLQTWQVPMIIGLLPVLLHVSLALFFAGLVVFMFSLGMKVAWLVSIIGAATYTAYVIALILPLVYPYCPYKVPLTFFTHRLYQFVNNCLIPRVVLVLRYPYTHMFRHDDHSHLPGSNDWLQDFLKSRQRKGPTLKEMELTHVQENAAKVDAQLLLWLHSSTSNTSVDESVLQAFAGMPSSTCEHLPAEYISALVISLAMHVEPLVTLSPDTDRELELYYRAYLVLRPYSWLGIFPQCDQIADQCSNEQLKVLLHSRNPEKAPTVLLEILRGPQRSSLPLHSVVWKALVDVAIPSRSAALELELELMKSLATFPSTSESGDVTTIDKPTYELRRHILDKLSEHWGYDHTRIPAGIDSVHLGTMIVLVSRIQQRFRNFIYVLDRKRLIEASLAFLAIIEHTHLLIPILDWKEVKTVLDMLYSLLSSDTFAIVGDLEALVRRIFMILDEHRSWFEHSIRMRSHSPTNRQFFSITYQCYLRSLADGDEKLENDTILPILEHFLSFCLRMYHDSDSHGILAFSKFYPLVLLRHEDEQIWDLFRIDSLVEVMLLLIKGHNESILYEWAQLPVMRRVWPRCLRRLVQWSLAEQFRQWDFLKRVLTIVVIGELRNMLGYGDDKESLPRYDYEPYTAVANQLPWLHEVQVSSGSSRCPFSFFVVDSCPF